MAQRRGSAARTLLLESPAATRKLGRAIGRLAQGGDVVALYGDLGAGKTLLTKGIASGAGFRRSREVTSPSFVLAHEYPGRVPIYHLDAYRLEGTAALHDIGCDEFFYGPGLCVVEWAERLEAVLPAERLEIFLEHVGDRRRRARLKARGERAREILRQLERQGYLSGTDQ